MPNPCGSAAASWSVPLRQATRPRLVWLARHNPVRFELGIRGNEHLFFALKGRNVTYVLGSDRVHHKKRSHQFTP